MGRKKMSVLILVSFLFLVSLSSPVMAVPSPPILSVVVTDTGVTFSWSAVNGATGYFLSYAPSPYTGPASIVTLNAGASNMLSADLTPGAAFLTAVQAQDSTGLSVYSNVEEVSIPQQGAQGYHVFAFNDLGMHCYDSDFSVFSILPLFNVVNAQVIQKGASPQILSDTVSVGYKAMADSTGSINTTSAGKTDFWTYVLPLFGADPPVDEGLLGAKMPGCFEYGATLSLENRLLRLVFSGRNPHNVSGRQQQEKFISPDDGPGARYRHLGNPVFSPGGGPRVR